MPGRIPRLVRLLAGAALVVALVAVLVRAGGDEPSGRAQPREQRLFAPGSVWNVVLPADTELDPRSRELVDGLAAQVRTSGAWINSTRFSTALYTVPAGQRRVPVHIDRPHDMFTNHADAAELERRLASVPIPPGARPALGTDQHMVIWQPATDTMWELWKAHEPPRDNCPWRRRSVHGWHAAWGGRIDGVSESAGVVDHPFGATASGLPMAGGLMRIDELKAGRIDHALAIALPHTARGIARPPANRTDGDDPRPAAIPEGTRFRLDPTLDIESLRLHPVAHAMAQAAQRHGIVVRDRAGAVAFYAEAPRPGAPNPYGDLFGGQWPSRILKGFPWRRLQALPPFSSG